MISKEEKLKLHKIAEEQIQTRIANGSSRKKAIRQTYNTLDIEAICPDFIKARKAKAEKIMNMITDAGTDVIKKITAKKTIVEATKADNKLEAWMLSDEHGMRAELKEICVECMKKEKK